MTLKTISLWQVWSWQLSEIGWWEKVVSNKSDFEAIFYFNRFVCQLKIRYGFWDIKVLVSLYRRVQFKSLVLHSNAEICLKVNKKVGIWTLLRCGVWRVAPYPEGDRWLLGWWWQRCTRGHVGAIGVTNIKILKKICISFLHHFLNITHKNLWIFGIYDFPNVVNLIIKLWLFDQSWFQEFGNLA